MLDQPEFHTRPCSRGLVALVSWTWPTEELVRTQARAQQVRAVSGDREARHLHDMDCALRMKVEINKGQLVYSLESRLAQHEMRPRSSAPGPGHLESEERKSG